jgi:pimeloyl-ACP methyl ester carboxylesterase
MRIVRLGLLSYLGVVTVLFSLQVRLIFPGASTQGQSFAEVRPRPGTELVNLTTKRGERVVALYGPALGTDGRPDPQAAHRPTLIYFYGNAMCLNDTADQLEKFRRLGLNVIIPDYVGYGMSGGSPSEKGCQATADAVYDFLVTTQGARPERIISAGWSLGGAVAIDLASRRQVGGLIAFSSFTSMVEMSHRILPFVPARLLLRHRFDSLKKIQHITCPILIGHGRLDGVVPFDMGQELAAKDKGPVTTLWVDQAEHNDFFDAGGKRLEEAIAKFARECSGP